jgi:hypothetical protein
MHNKKLISANSNELLFWPYFIMKIKEKFNPLLVCTKSIMGELGLYINRMFFIPLYHFKYFSVT